MVKYKGRTKPIQEVVCCYKRTGCLRVSTPSSCSFCRNTVSTLLVSDRIEFALQITMSSSAQPIAAQQIAAQQIAAHQIAGQQNVSYGYLTREDKVYQANKAAENSELTLRLKDPASELQKFKFIYDYKRSNFVIRLLSDDRFAIEGGREDGSKCVLRLATGNPELLQQWVIRTGDTTDGFTLSNTNGLRMTARGDSILSTESISSDTEIGLFFL